MKSWLEWSVPEEALSHTATTEHKEDHGPQQLRRELLQNLQLVPCHAESHIDISLSLQENNFEIFPFLFLFFRYLHNSYCLFSL